MRNPIYEQALNKQGVKWHYEKKVDLDEINFEKSKQNQVRLKEPLIEDLVNNYAQEVKDGDVFPPFVLHRPSPKAKYLHIDGLNRHAAFLQAKKESHDAYVVDTDSNPVLIRLRASFNNAVNGQRMTYEDLLWHAIELVQLDILPVNFAAKECGVKAWEVTRRVQELELRSKFDARNLQHKQINTDTIIDLAPIAKVGDDVYIRAVSTAHQCGASHLDRQELVKIVKNASSHNDKLKAVEAFGQTEKMQRQRAETKGGSIRPSNPLPRDKFLRHLRELSRLLGSHADNALKPVRADYEQAHSDAASIADRLTLLFGLGSLPSRKEKSA
jgi:hypothetical protein